MATFFFNLRDGKHLLEANEGQEFACLDDARRDAEQGARDMLAEMVRHGKEVDGQVIEVLDSSRAIVATVRLMDELHLKAKPPS